MLQQELCQLVIMIIQQQPPIAHGMKGRDGFVMGEGAGCVVLEDYEHAKSRGAKIYAEILGYGLSADAYHITAPSEDGDGGYRAMQAAIINGGVDITEINYINAHGTSTPLGDEIELGAVKKLFQDNISNLSVSSTKSSVGHMLGAAGAVEAIFSILAVSNDIIPPTLNLENPCDSAEGIDLVPLKAKEKNKYSFIKFFWFWRNKCFINCR